MDVEPPTTPGQPAVTGPGTYAAVMDTTYTWSNVAPGNHTFSVQLVNNDHTPLATPVVATIAVSVPSSTTEPYIQLLAVQVMPASSPTATSSPGQTGSVSDVMVSIEVENLTLVPPTTGNVAGQGHIQYSLDPLPTPSPTATGAPAETVSPTVSPSPSPTNVYQSSDTLYTWAGVTSGEHVFRVELVNNDNTPLSPPVAAEAMITLP